MTSAQRDLLPLDELSLDGAPVEMEAEGAPFALKEQVAQRLAAHRARRHQPDPATVRLAAKAGPGAGPGSGLNSGPNSGLNSGLGKARSSRIAATVAERYAKSQSYRAFLAAEAEKAIREAEAASREAEAAARVAALSAQAVADAQYELLDELDQWALTSPPAPAPDGAGMPEQMASAELQAAPAFTVRMYEEVAVPQSASRHVRSRGRVEDADEAEDDALDEEIAFRQAPVFDEFGGAQEIPANLIEFPRQLVAARRARPRLAEGPLREEAERCPDAAQLRIFEVEAAHISTAPRAADGIEGGSVEPEWSSILLAAHPVFAPVESSENPVFAPQFAPQTAPLNLRLMAAMVDGCIVTAGLLGFVAAFAISSAKISMRLYGGYSLAALSGPAAIETVAIGAVATLMVLAVMYQLLFFTFSEATPGMRYARIGLCTFSDDNPSRSSMRRRIFAGLLAACPLGIGFLWAWLDEEGLGWHDRISRMYQRSY